MIGRMVIESVNVGKRETIRFGSKSVETGILKRPAEGRVRLSTSGIEGDFIGDPEHHGGPDQALYAYSADDYDWWSIESGRRYRAGEFGENLTIRGLSGDLYVGDRLLIGSAVLEVTSPRIPCSTLTAAVRDKRFGIAFREAEKPGIYLRVLNGGHVGAGDTVTLVDDAASDVTILDLFRFNYARQHDADTLRRYLTAPIAERFRLKVERRLQALESG